MPSERQNKYSKLTSDQPDQLIPIKKYFKQLPVSPRLGGEKRNRLDLQVRIRTKITVKPSKEPGFKPSNIASIPEDKHTKIIPARHTIRMIWTKKLKHIGTRSQEDSLTDNNKVCPFCNPNQDEW